MLLAAVLPGKPISHTKRRAPEIICSYDSGSKGQRGEEDGSCPPQYGLRRHGCVLVRTRCCPESKRLSDSPPQRDASPHRFLGQIRTVTGGPGSPRRKQGSRATFHIARARTGYTDRYREYCPASPGLRHPEPAAAGPAVAWRQWPRSEQQSFLLQSLAVRAVRVDVLQHIFHRFTITNNGDRVQRASVPQDASNHAIGTGSGGIIGLRARCSTVSM